MRKHLSFFSSSLLTGGDGEAPPSGPDGALVAPAAGTFRMTNLERPFRISWILRFRAAFLCAADSVCNLAEVTFPAL